MDLLGDLGGVTEVIMIIFGFILYPISEHSYTLKAIKRLYLARTNKNGLFLEEKNKKEKYQKFEMDMRRRSREVDEELSKH